MANSTVSDKAKELWDAARLGDESKVVQLAVERAVVGCPVMGVRGTAMHWCAYGNMPLGVVALLRSGASAKAWDCEEAKETPLHWAAAWGSEAVVRELLRHSSALASVLDARKRSPVHVAAARGQIGALECLLMCEEGRKAATSLDKDNFSARHWAGRRNDALCIALLGGGGPIVRARFEKVEDVDWALRQLLELDLTGTGLSDASAIAESFPLLSRLTLPHNSIPDVAPLCRLTRLRHLVLDNNPTLVRLPILLTALQSLQFFSLKGCTMRMLSPQLGDFLKGLEAFFPPALLLIPEAQRAKNSAIFQYLADLGKDADFYRPSVMLHGPSGVGKKTLQRRLQKEAGLTVTVAPYTQQWFEIEQRPVFHPTFRQLLQGHQITLEVVRLPLEVPLQSLLDERQSNLLVATHGDQVGGTIDGLICVDAVRGPITHLVQLIRQVYQRGQPSRVTTAVIELSRWLKESGQQVVHVQDLLASDMNVWENEEGLRHAISWLHRLGEMFYCHENDMVVVDPELINGLVRNSQWTSLTQSLALYPALWNINPPALPLRVHFQRVCTFWQPPLGLVGCLEARMRLRCVAWEHGLRVTDDGVAMAEVCVSGCNAIVQGTADAMPLVVELWYHLKSMRWLLHRSWFITCRHAVSDEVHSLSPEACAVMLTTPGSHDECRNNIGADLVMSNLPRYAADSVGYRSDQERIGSGTFANVYRVDIPDGRQCALKILKSDHCATATLVEDLRLEVQALSKVIHENVIAVRGLVIDQGVFGVLVEMCSEGSLSGHLNGRLDTRRRISALYDGARGLQAIHEAGLLHLDIKADNLFVTSEWRCKWGDFGLTRAGTAIWNDFDDSMLQGDRAECLVKTLSWKQLGTPGFVAPEILRYGRFDTGADLYSFGLTIHQVLSDNAPNTSSRDWQAQVLSGYRPPVDASWPPHVVGIMRQLWDSEARRRPSAEECAKVLMAPDIEVVLQISHDFTEAPIALQTGGTNSNIINNNNNSSSNV